MDFNQLENDKTLNEMRDGYLQYRTAQFLLMYDEAKSRGIIQYLEKPRSVEEIAKNFNFSRWQKGLVGVIKALRYFNIISEKSANSQTHYQLVENHELPKIDNALLKKAVGESGFEKLKQIGAFSKIFQYMEGQSVDVLFDEENESLWQEFLEYPYYCYGRDIAAQYISFPGAKVLDMGAGLGHGTETLAQFVGTDGKAVALESSEAFVKTAKRRLSHIPQVEVVCQDMGSKTSDIFGEKYFDGVMFIGAFHYVKEKQQCLEEMAKIMKPGGKIVIGNTCTLNGALDEGMLQFGTAMIDPPAYSITPAEHHEQFNKSGFVVNKEYYFGCQGWYFMQYEA